MSNQNVTLTKEERSLLTKLKSLYLYAVPSELGEKVSSYAVLEARGLVRRGKVKQTKLVRGYYPIMDVVKKVAFRLTYKGQKALRNRV